MAEMIVVDGAMLQCSAGTMPSQLISSPVPTPLVSGCPMCSILDNRSGINILSFGFCKLKGMACVPSTPLPWSPGATEILHPSRVPILSSNSTLSCIQGGIITILSPGQRTLRFGHLKAISAPIKLESPKKASSGTTEIYARIAFLLSLGVKIDIHDDGTIDGSFDLGGGLSMAMEGKITRIEDTPRPNNPKRVKITILGGSAGIEGAPVEASLDVVWIATPDPNRPHKYINELKLDSDLAHKIGNSSASMGIDGSSIGTGYHYEFMGIQMENYFKFKLREGDDKK